MTDQALWALIGTLFGGAGLAIINKLLGRNKERFDLGAAIRNELRKDNTDYRNEIEELRNTVDSLEKQIEAMRKVLIQNGIDYPPL